MDDLVHRLPRGNPIEVKLVLAVLTLKVVVVRRGHAAVSGRRTEQRDESSGKASGEED